ncbi:MAG: gluconolactonase, partial [Chthonomonadales bacterium]|nr:gluconolactonase [Chthonomonadales bacterium]
MTISSSDSEVWKAILPEDAEIEKIAGGFQFTEGPLWDQRGFLLFSDIPASTLYQWTP